MATAYDHPIVKIAGPYTVTLYSADHATVTWSDGDPKTAWTKTIRKVLAEGDTNPKIDTNLIATKGFSMTPHKLGGLGNVCSWATTCIKSCLNETGHGPQDNVRQRRLAHYVLYFVARDWLVSKLIRELKAFGAGLPEGEYGGVRLNVFSDVPWEKFGVIDAMPANVIPYDYTKDPIRAAKQPYNLTYSYDGTVNSEHYAKILLSRGVNVSVVFHEQGLKRVCGKWSKEQRMPSTFLGVRVIDGTETDWRPADPRGVVVGLLLKALSHARRNDAIDTGFSVDVSEVESGTYVPVIEQYRPLVAI